MQIYRKVSHTASHDWLYDTIVSFTVWKVSKYGVISGPHFPVFSPSAGNYGPQIPPYLDTFHAILLPRLVLFRSNAKQLLSPEP